MNNLSKHALLVLVLGTVLGFVPAVGWAVAAAERDDLRESMTEFQEKFDDQVAAGSAEALGRRECHEGLRHCQNSREYLSEIRDSLVSELGACQAQVAACPVCPETCEGPRVACALACRMPVALCVETELGGDSFTSRLAFFFSDSQRWLATPHWTDGGQKFDYNMGLNLDLGDRNFLRHGGGRPTYDGMEFRPGGDRNSLSYRLLQVGDRTKLLVCGELNWHDIREPGDLGEGGDEDG